MKGKDTGFQIVCERIAWKKLESDNLKEIKVGKETSRKALTRKKIWRPATFTFKKYCFQPDSQQFDMELKNTECFLSIYFFFKQKLPKKDLLEFDCKYWILGSYAKPYAIAGLDIQHWH